MVYRVYVIQNQEGKFYIGVSDDVARRVEQQHNSGQSRWTKRRRPWSPDKARTNRLSVASRESVHEIYAPAIQRSSVVERSAVNRLVVGSNPTAGANFYVLGVHPSKSGRPLLRWPHG